MAATLSRNKKIALGVDYAADRIYPGEMLDATADLEDLDFGTVAMRPTPRQGRLEARGVRFQVRLASGRRIATTGNLDTATAISARTRGSRVVEVVR